MSATDFFDDDLVQKRESDGMKPEREQGSGLSADMPVRTQSISGLPPSRLSKYMENVEGKMSGASEELERLKRKQEALERERSSLENLRNDQEKYLKDKRGLLDAIEKSIVSMQREELLLNQRVELVGEISRRFREMLAELKAFREDEWPEDSERLQNELSKALVVMDEMKKEYGKAVAKIQASQDESPERHEKKAGSVFDEFVDEPEREKTFGYWFKAGFAATLPILAALVALCVIIFIRGF